MTDALHIGIRTSRYRVLFEDGEVVDFVAPHLDGSTLRGEMLRLHYPDLTSNAAKDAARKAGTYGIAGLVRLGDAEPLGDDATVAWL